MKSNSNQTSGGIGFLGLLTIVFIVLKLTAVITWSWWWILSPMWIPLTIALVVAVVAFSIGYIKYIKKMKK